MTLVKSDWGHRGEWFWAHFLPANGSLGAYRAGLFGVEDA